MVNAPWVSVVVVVRDRKKQLRACLQSLFSQEFSRSFEVIVINNASRDNLQDVLADYDVRVFSEPVPSIPIARNRGIRESKGSYVAFIDSDCIADKGWLETSTLCALNRDVDCVAGQIAVPPAYRWIEIYDQGRFDHGHVMQSRMSAPSLPWVSTSNVLLRKSVFYKIGFFDEVFFRQSDLDLTVRLYLAGCTIRYEPAAIVTHRHRENFRVLLRWRYVVGKSALLPYIKYRSILGLSLWSVVGGIILGECLRSLQYVRSLWRHNKGHLGLVLMDALGSLVFVYGFAVGIIKYGWLDRSRLKVFPRPLDREGITWPVKEGQLVLVFSSGKARHYFLNEVGGRMAALYYKDHCSVKDVIRRIADEYSVPASTAREDVRNFLSGMKSCPEIGTIMAKESGIDDWS